MKLLLENWREYLSEEETLEEGWKDWLLAAVMGLNALGGTIPTAQAASKPVPVQVQKKEQTVNIKNYGEMSVQDYHFLMGLFKTNNSDASNQVLMKIAYDLQSGKARSTAIAKKLKSLITNAKVNSKYFASRAKTGKSVHVEELESHTTDRTQRTDGSGKTVRKTTTVYQWASGGKTP